MIDIGYYNGKIGPLSEMTVPMDDRAVYFGDGVYEATMVGNGIPFALEEHFDRFYSSLKLMRIDFKMPRETLKSEILSCVKAAGAEGGECWIYWQCSRGTAPRNHVFPPAGVEPNLLITITEYEKESMDQKLHLTLVEDTRFLHCNIKTLNLIPSVMASQTALERKCDEAVFHRGDIVTECAHSNLLILKNKKLYTHPADNFILPGISRKHLIELATENGIQVIEEPFTIDEMMASDEVIVSSSGTFCLAAEDIDGVTVGGKDPELFAFLQKLCLEKYSAYISQNK